MPVPLGGLIAAGVAGGYIVTSLLLLRFPHLLHKKKKTKFCSRHISHRGGAGENLENTMTAFRHALSCGTQMLELDVQLTADKQVVVSHDNNLHRVCGQDIHISDLDYEKLPPLKSEIGITFKPGIVVEASNDDKKIPLLREVFKEFPEIPINIDVKENNDELIDEVYALICEYKRQNTIAWGNFREEINKKLYKKDPEISLFFSLRRVVITVVLFYIGLLPFVPLKESYLEIIYARPMLSIVLARWRWLIRFLSWLLLTPVMFRHLERRGIQTYLWVLNEDEDFEQAYEHLGVHGIMTDYPRKLQSYLERKRASSSTPLIKE